MLLRLVGIRLWLACGLLLFSTAALAEDPAPAASPPPSPAAAAGGAQTTGLAAVYNTRLQGHRTASGERYDKNKLTAAHPSLPFGSRVKVTNTKNQKTVEVRINDRGPTQAGRILGLSTKAAHALGIGPNGTAEVQIEVLEQGEPGQKKAHTTKR